MRPLEESGPEVRCDSFGEDDFSHAIVFEQLVEFDVETPVGFAVEEGDEILA